VLTQTRRSTALAAFRPSPTQSASPEQPLLQQSPWADHDALGADVSGQDAGRAVDTVSPQKVRKKFSRGQEKSLPANDDKSAFAQVRAIFPARTNNGQ